MHIQVHSTSNAIQRLAKTLSSMDCRELKVHGNWAVVGNPKLLTCNTDKASVALVLLWLLLLSLISHGFSTRALCALLFCFLLLVGAVLDLKVGVAGRRGVVLLSGSGRTRNIWNILSSSEEKSCWGKLEYNVNRLFSLLTFLKTIIGIQSSWF